MKTKKGRPRQGKSLKQKINITLAPEIVAKIDRLKIFKTKIRSQRIGLILKDFLEGVT